MKLPITPAELQASRRPLGQATTLPAVAYTSEEVFNWERRHLYAASWTCLGRTADLAAAGNQREEPVGDISVVLTFSNGGPKAFANLCRHRAHELLSTGTQHDRPTLVCPYHGWAYGLDGALRTAPRMELDKESFRLVELPCVDWHGWLFVNATGTAIPFAEHIGALEGHVAPYAPAGLVVKARHDYDIAANWKILPENYHECYHCPLIHPELCVVTPPTSGINLREAGTWVGGAMQLREHAETMSMDGRSRGVMLPGADPRRVGYFGLFPNLLIALHPDYVMTHRFVPVAPGRTRVECQWLFDPSVTDPSYAVDFWDVVNRQDWLACESVQRGVSSPHFRPGPLASNEDAVYDWLQLVTNAYLNN